jgi:hypothetical protein
MMDDANSLAMVLAYGPPDKFTYRDPMWTDADGNIYAAAEWSAGPNFIGSATATLERPAWDVEPYEVNMAGAERAQEALVFWAGDEPLPKARPDKLTAIAGIPAKDALEAMGLTAVEVEV